MTTTPSRLHIADTTRKPKVWECYGLRPWVRNRTRCGRMVGVDIIADALDDATCETCQRWLARQRLAYARAVESETEAMRGETAREWRP